MPASSSASVHGPVRPVWLHGSRVTYAVPPRPPGHRPSRAPRPRRAARRRARGSPRRPTSPSRSRTTQPTTGFGMGGLPTARGQLDGTAHRGHLDARSATRSLPCSGALRAFAGELGGRAHRRTPPAAAPTALERPRVRLPSGLSPSVPEFHQVNRPLDCATGSRTVTAGSEFHRPRSTLCVRTCRSQCATHSSRWHRRRALPAPTGGAASGGVARTRRPRDRLDGTPVEGWDDADLAPAPRGPRLVEEDPRDRWRAALRRSRTSGTHELERSVPLRQRGRPAAATPGGPRWCFTIAVRALGDRGRRRGRHPAGVRRRLARPRRLQAADRQPPRLAARHHPQQGGRPLGGSASASGALPTPRPGRWLRHCPVARPTP